MPRKLEYNAKVIQRIEIAPGLIIIRVAPEGELFDFKPGQYTVLGRKRKEPRCLGSDPEPEELQSRDPDEMIRRAYSIASSSLERKHLDIYLALVRSGELTPRLFNLQIGDPIYLGPKATGMFTLEQAPNHKHILMVSTGTGLAPYISMIRTHLRDHPDRVILVLHGARYSWDLGYRDELVTLSRVWPCLHYFGVVSRKESDSTWDGLNGYVQHYLEDRFVQEATGLSLTPDNFNAFLCGNPAMIEEAIQILEAKGFRRGDRKSPGEIHVEEYW